MVSLPGLLISIINSCLSNSGLTVVIFYKAFINLKSDLDVKKAARLAAQIEVDLLS
jgi:hypothetical protein